ncbi:succinylglutamate desuccinylase/aspartoacylase family protein [Methanococcoides sp. FTZ1]|uniref:succinylglutamate desuccinylase/aspartoacylase family protein n=1 Tax=Methanococcoides sp. FTZ1 TaxID=3439061 RepID=UPI003F82B757
MSMKNTDITIGGVKIKPGTHVDLELPAASLYTQTPLKIPVHVIHGKKKGPCLFVVAGIHGDEINGVEIIRRLLRSSKFRGLNGTLIAVPIVNVYGFVSLSRYLPDRRDLNRSFPGSEKGSLASRLANVLIKEIVSNCTHGIDLHTGSIHRSNLPQVRVNLEMPGIKDYAKAFAIPVIINSNLRDGSLREACTEMEIPLIVYEGGEALRFDEVAIRAGVKGIRNVMKELGMIRTKPNAPTNKKVIEPMVARSNKWVRAPESGIVHSFKRLGADVEKGESLGVIVDPFGHEEVEILSPISGIIIGKNNLPLVNEGDAVFHIAGFEKLEIMTSQVDTLQKMGPVISEGLFSTVNHDVNTLGNK